MPDTHCWGLSPPKLMQWSPERAAGKFFHRGSSTYAPLTVSLCSACRTEGPWGLRSVFTDQGDYGRGGGKEIEETTAGVSWNDWAATKPIGEMRAWPKRHEEKRDEGGEKMCELGGARGGDNTLKKGSGSQGVKNCRWGRREMEKRRVSLLFVVHSCHLFHKSGGRRAECGLGFQGHRMLLRSEILDIPSVTLSAGGQVFQTGRLRAARGGCRNTWKNQSGCQTKRRYCNVPRLVNSLWCRVKGCWSLQWWAPAEITGHTPLSTDTKKLKALYWKAPSWHLTQNLLVEVTPGSAEPGFNWEINPSPQKSQQWQPVN